jgi:ferredoxin
MMTMTCAVKNLFGAVVGTEKAGWHLKAGSSRQLFAKLLLEIYLLKKPVLNIVDAIVAMEGNGPGSGDPLERGVLIAGANAVAVDVIAGKLAGITAELLPIEQEAISMGLSGALFEEIKLCGVPFESIPEISFKLPAGMDVQFGLPPFMTKALKSHLTSYPAANPKTCVLCGVCRDACPPGAISIKNSALSVDKARCIRCWCCRELCPHSAMETKRGILLKTIRLLSGRK